MSEIEGAAALLAAAVKDPRALEGMNDPAVFADEVFGFHAQQAAEEALKAWIAALGGEYPLTHNLATLLTTLQNLGVDVEGLWDLVEYNPFGVQFRYEALDEAEELLDRLAATRGLRQLHDRVGQAIREAT